MTFYILTNQGMEGHGSHAEEISLTGIVFGIDIVGCRGCFHAVHFYVVWNTLEV